MRSYTTKSGVLVEVGQCWTDVYRGSERVIEVVDIADPWTDSNGRQRCSVVYRVVARGGRPVDGERVKSIDAARLADPRLYLRIGGRP